MKQLYKDIKKLYAEHRDVILSEGWCIANRADDTYEIYAVKKGIFGYIHFDFNPIKEAEALNNARIHGITCNKKCIIIKLDRKQFNNTLYLWQAKELGIL